MSSIQITTSLEGPARNELLKELSSIVGSTAMEIRKEWNQSNPIFTLNLYDGDAFKNDVYTFNTLIEWAERNSIATRFHLINPESDRISEKNIEQVKNIIERALSTMDSDTYFDVN